MNKHDDWKDFLEAAKEVEKDYYAELQKVKNLTEELNTAKVEHDKLFKNYSEVKNRTRELELRLKKIELDQDFKAPSEVKSKVTNDDVSSMKIKMRASLLQLHEETERLRAVYPVYDLLAAKQTEVDRMKKALTTVSRDHPERKIVESMVKSHIIERDELRWIVQDAESRFKLQIERIQAELSSLLDDDTASCTPIKQGFSQGGNSKKSIRVPEH